MKYFIVGLGNPGQEYEGTRHNTGRIILQAIYPDFGSDDFKSDNKTNSLIAKGKIGKNEIIFMMPETFMNNSGKAVVKMVKSKKDATRLIVIYDDFNLPIGTMRISFNRSSGGHNGLESIIKMLGTQEFTRIRIGMAPEKKDGTAKVPHGEDKIEKFILGKFDKDEVKIINKLSKKVSEAIKTAITEGRDKAMSIFN